MIDILSKLYVMLQSQMDVWLNSQILNNDFLIAGVGTALLTAALYVLRNVPRYIISFLKHKFTHTVSIYSTSSNFYDISSFLSKHTISWLSREKNFYDSKLQVDGNSIVIFNKTLIFVSRQVQESDSYEFKETLKLTIPFKSEKSLKILMEMIDEEAKNKNPNNIEVFTLVGNDYMKKTGSISKRTRQNVFSSDEIIDLIESKIDWFKNNREWYMNRGIPYKLSFLLYGEPGTGKTTLAKYIASYSDRNLFYAPIPKLPDAISISDRHSGSSDLEDIRKRSVIVTEDIDNYKVTHKRGSSAVRKKDTKNSEIEVVNLSELLNSIDGVKSVEDLIIVATTNDIGILDEALLRKGRFDVLLLVGKLKSDEIKKMITNFFENTEIDSLLEGKEFEPITGANLQDILISNYDNQLNIFTQLKYKENKVG